MKGAFVRHLKERNTDGASENISGNMLAYKNTQVVSKDKNNN